MIISDKIYCKLCGAKVYRYKQNHMKVVHQLKYIEMMPKLVGSFTKKEIDQIYDEAIEKEFSKAKPT